jgi:hypothetical protein
VPSSESCKHRVESLDVGSHLRFSLRLSLRLRADLNRRQIHILILLLDLDITSPDFDCTCTFSHYNIFILLDGLLIGTRIALLTRSTGGPAKLSYPEGLLLAN